MIILASSPKPPRSPTMTMHTKAATEEVYEMFNQPLKDADNSDDSDAYSDNYTEYTETMNKQPMDESGMNDLTTQTQELTVNDQQQVESSEEPLEMPSTPGVGTRLPPMMTPIVEATETNFTNSAGTQFPVLNTSPLIELKTFNPLDEEIRIKILSSLNPPLSAYGTYLRFKGQNFDKEPSIKRTLKRNEKSSLPILEFPTTGTLFCVRKILGEGSFGSVYLAESESGHMRAIKIQKHILAWEYYILQSAQARLKYSRSLTSIINSESLFGFDDESYMVMNYHSQGTMLDLVNLIHSRNDGSWGLGELLTTFFTVELLRTVESLHSCGIIHGDIKPDNVMLRLEIIQDHEWSKYYDIDGNNGWSRKGIALIDFGRASDMSILSPDVQFTANWDMDEQDCIEMQRGEPWTYQVDYHGVATVIHLMLFGKVINTTWDDKVKLTNNFKRYWQKELWEELFNVLLNSRSMGSLPIIDRLRDCRSKLENRLAEVCESGGNSLRGSLKLIEEEIGFSKRR